MAERSPGRITDQRGMSLVDILVGMVIGLIGMIIVFQSFNAFEGQKRTTTVTNDAQEGGLMALTTIEREIRLAGFGMFYASNPICNSYRQWANNAVDTVASFMPVTVTNGASNAPDSVTLAFSSSGFGSTPSQVQVTFNGTVAEIVVDNALGNRVYNVGDYILVGKTGSACTRLQVSGTRPSPDNPQFLALKVEPTTAAPANPPLANLATLLPSGGYSNEKLTPTSLSVVSNMGQMRRVTYAVVLDANNNGKLQQQDLTGGGAAIDLAEGIVNMQAQYGISTSESVQQVSSWVNASGSWAAPAFSDQGRIKAIRIAVVARSQLREKDVVQSVNATCSNTSGTNNNGPCEWRDSVANPAPIIDLSANSEWRYYRYRVYETIIPLRNVMWQY